MVQKRRTINPRDRGLLLGCGGMVVLLAIGCLLIFSLTFYQDRQAGRYPGSVELSSHNNYKGLPFHYRWDNSYLTTDNFTQVYNWYSIFFDLGAESRANGECILLDGARTVLFTTRYTSVLLCSTPAGQMVYVTRSTSFR